MDKNEIIKKVYYDQGKLNLSLELLMFLKNWLTDHILKTDSEYGVFIKSKGAGL